MTKSRGVGRGFHGTPESRFWKRVVKSPGCWSWNGECDDFGYGRVAISKGNGTCRRFRAHRFSWQLHSGPVPEGLCVLHRCDNPPCTNPDHLFLGTIGDNTADMVTKGRQRAPFGEAQHCAKLTKKSVKTIRKIYDAGGISQRALARKFGIDQKTLFCVIHRKSWAHI